MFLKWVSSGYKIVSEVRREKGLPGWLLVKKEHKTKGRQIKEKRTFIIAFFNDLVKALQNSS
jgi:hypothetical protein